MKTSRSFSIGGALSKGWQLTKDNFGFLVSLFVILILVEVGLGVVQGILKGGNHDLPLYLGLVMTIVRVVVNIVTSMILVNGTLQVVDGKKPTLQTAFEGMLESKLMVQYFLATLIVGLLEAVGFILLIVPGIYFSLKYLFTTYALVDRRSSASEAMEISSKLTQGLKWQLFGFELVCLLVNLGGFLCFVIGMAVTVPLTTLAKVYVYRQLTGALAAETK